MNGNIALTRASPIVRTKTQVAFGSLWLFIVMVSVWDSYLTFIHRRFMEDQELNPIGQALIALGDGGVTYFLLAKMAGTILVATILAALFEHSSRKALVIAIPIALFQFCLLMYLSFA